MTLLKSFEAHFVCCCSSRHVSLMKAEARIPGSAPFAIYLRGYVLSRIVAMRGAC